MSNTARNRISCIPECKWVEEYFAFLNKQIQSLSEKQKRDIISRIVSSDDNQYHEAIAELVYIAFWNKLNWSFEKDPEINGKTPDFKVCFDKEHNRSFLCDVTVVRHNHPHQDQRIDFDEKTGITTITVDGKVVDELPLITEPIDQAHRFLMRIKEKFENYRNILNDIPFVICFYQFEDTFYLNDFQITNALFGDLKLDFKTGESWHQPSIQTTKHNQNVKRGIFGFEEYKPLMAIITCEQEFYQTSNTIIDKPKPHYPQKAKFSFGIYANLLGEWANKDNNPFSLLGFPVNGLIDVDKLQFCAPKEIEFY